MPKLIRPWSVLHFPLAFGFYCIFFLRKHQMNEIVACNTVEYEVKKWQQIKTEREEKYTPSALEEYLFMNADDFGMNSSETMTPMCDILGHFNIVKDYHRYLENLDVYNNQLKTFVPLREDIRSIIAKSGNSACDTLEISGGLELSDSNLFAQSELSYSSTVGALEPILPPLRHPRFCQNKDYGMDLSYMVHDFPMMCRTLKTSSRTIFLDIGASLDFHGVSDRPAMYILNLYRKFGFYFDHIYAYEVTPKQASEVFKKVPREYFAAYHWMNVAIENDPQSLLNPLQMLIANFNKDDFVVIKMDIDTSSIEVPLAYQLLQDERLIGLVDQFYFEHHVHLQELAGAWGATMNGTVSESIHLFQSLRRKGIGAHSWV